MKINKLKMSALLSVVLMLPPAISSIAIESKYIALEGGFALPGKLKSEIVVLSAGGVEKQIDSLYRGTTHGATMYGASAGIKFSEHFKFDFSLLRTGKMQFRGLNSMPSEGVLTPPLTEHSQSINSSTVFANLHYSFPYMWFKDYNLTPYMSIALGTSSNKVSDYKMSPMTADRRITVNDKVEVEKIKKADASITGAQKRCFAYGLGFGVDHTFENIELSLGYKFYHLGKVSTTDIASLAIDKGQVSGASMPSKEYQVFVGRTKDNKTVNSNLYIHTVMFGIRSYF